MSRSPLWREFESGDSFLVRLLRWLVMGGGLIFLVLAGMLDLTWPQQAVLGLLLVFIAIWIDRSSTSYIVTLTLMLLSCFSTFRYGFWRISTVMKFFADPGTAWTWLDAFFILLLIAAELYAFSILYLGFLQTLWPLRRTPVPLPDDTALWPEVDLLIPTFNEPLSVVKFTALAAMNIDWPADRLNVYILDDGKREEFRAFAEEAGVGYMTRDDNAHAKAGNINRALQRLDAPFVAIFDSDHVPTRSFLQLTMGWFERDRRLGILQTPHHFYSPDPFERNLGQFRVIPNEGELFYGVVQDGNDFWNSTFFCGSCAVMRREALDQVGGIAVETVTEDAHTSLRMQMRGWNTAYINIPQAAGLATERLSGHVKQRIRWARGMIQILRTENPLFGSGLSAAQRLCYFNAMSHFLYALPRLIFLTAPLIYLILGHTNVPGYWAAIFAYAFPHLVLSNITNSRIQGQHRHSFWNEIYETVLAPYIFLPTMLALISPKLGSFNVTAKGGVVNRSFFDTRIAQPFLLLLALNVFGVICAIPRYLQIPFVHVWHTDVGGMAGFIGNIPYNILNLPANMNDGTHPGTIMMNLLWTLFNIVILGVATAVAWESQQRRQTVRVAMAVPVGVVLPDGTAAQGVTADLSAGGAMMEFDELMDVPIGEAIRLVFPVLDGDATLPATIVGSEGHTLRAQFEPLTIQEEEALTMVLYSRADTWLGWGESREVDRPALSFWRIIQLSAFGLRRTLRGLLVSRRQNRARMANAAPLLALFAVLGGMLFATENLHAQEQTSAYALQAVRPINLTNVPQRPAPVSSRVNRASTRVDAVRTTQSVPSATFDNSFRIRDLNVPDAITLRGVDSRHTVYFALPRTENVRAATLKLYFHFSPGLLPLVSHLNVSLNGKMFASIPVTKQPSIEVREESDLTPEQRLEQKASGGMSDAQQSPLLSATLAMPAEMLVHKNELSFQFVGHYTNKCEDAANSTLWAHLDTDSVLEFSGSLLQLRNDLKMLPAPFYDEEVNLHPSLPIVFLSQPSSKVLQAAGVVASKFGMLADYRPMHFPVILGAIPKGNAVVIAESPASLPAGLGVTGTGPVVAMKTNPSDPYGKLLIVTGGNPDQVLEAAQVLALQFAMLSGEQANVRLTDKPRRREPDDAPRWLSTEHVTPLGDIAGTGDLQGDGSVPVGIYSRVPPDLYYGATQNLAFQMNYRYNGTPLANESSLQVLMNGAYISSTPMPHTDRASSVLSTRLAVPVGDMRPFSNTMLLHFIFQIAKKGYCQGTAPDNLQGAILKDSYLDLTGIPHWAKLPNLEIFANAGYPFTRRADLSDTAVVLPNNPEAAEIELFLTYMGHFGAQTGYPVLNVTVTDANGMKDQNNDYLVLGTVADQRDALQQLRDDLPVQLSETGVKVQDTQGFFNNRQHEWWTVRSSDRGESTGTLDLSGGLPNGIIEGLEWPRRSHHTVVLVALQNLDMFATFERTFFEPGVAQSSDVSHDVSVFDGTHFASYQVGEKQYNVGNLSWLYWLSMFAREHPWLIALVAVLFSFLMAGLLRAVLRRHARRRLQPVN